MDEFFDFGDTRLHGRFSTAAMGMGVGVLDASELECAATSSRAISSAGRVYSPSRSRAQDPGGGRSIPQELFPDFAGAKVSAATHRLRYRIVVLTPDYRGQDLQHYNNVSTSFNAPQSSRAALETLNEDCFGIAFSPPQDQSLWRIPSVSSSSPLHIAAAKGHFAVTKVLLEGVVEVNALDEGGLTALHHATMNGNTDIVRLLLESGGDGEMEDRTGWTSLHHAAARGDESSARLLVNYSSH